MALSIRRLCANPVAAALLAWSCLLPALAHGAACVEPPPDPTNTYDAPRTFDKVARNYPFIRIASAEAPAGVKVVRDLT